MSLAQFNPSTNGLRVQALQQQQQQLAEQERYKQQLLADRQRRIQQQHEQRQKLGDVSDGLACGRPVDPVELTSLCLQVSF